MPKDPSLQKILVIGSGPIIIGQAAEFDYAGTQACQVLQEEGIEVVLINSNPATIMTDKNMAKRTYLEPITPQIIEKIIVKERPDGILPTLGGQVGLNMALTLGRAGVFEKYQTRLLGTPLDAIDRSEDRQLFKEAMESIGEPVLDSYTVNDLSTALPLAEKIGYPLVVRPAFTLGGTGGGFCHDEQELRQLLPIGLKLSPIKQCLLEKSLKGWKEIEFEVMRDSQDNCIAICSMENMDPLGIHTGDSIVVAPTQTLDAHAYQMMRQAAINIIRSLGIEGGCNVQFTLDPLSKQYYVIEVNPRVSRSSALASKATGYPIARTAALIALGYRLDEIVNHLTGQGSANFEPKLDYLVAKVPRWPFDKFKIANKHLNTQMKSTGEVMAIGLNFPQAIQKAVRSLELGYQGIFDQDSEALDDQALLREIKDADDKRLFHLMAALRRGISLERIKEQSQIDMWFLTQLKRIIDFELKLKSQDLTSDLLKEAKTLGFADREIARLTNQSPAQVAGLRQIWKIGRTYKSVDTCGGQSEVSAPYFYGTFAGEDEASALADPKAVVIGSGPIRIGQGVEFDYSSVHALQALERAGIKSIMINNNPETVSTDFNISQRLYFEPLMDEEVVEILKKEAPLGAFVQFGGQTAINLTSDLEKSGIKILGSQPETIDLAEDRERFDALLEELNLKRPAGKGVRSYQQALKALEELGYPVLVRPSYVLGGRGMEICYSEKELEGYLNEAVSISPDHPVLIDRYIMGRELEVDAIADGERVLIAGIMEHIERAGVHSGDSTAVYPWTHIDPWVVEEICEATKKMALGLNVQGLINVQFVQQGDDLYVLEVNPRSSRTVPFLSKVADLPIVEIATKISLGQSLKEQGYEDGLWPPGNFYAAKAPVFSWAKLKGVEIGLGPEMKSTGEVIGLGRNKDEALARAFWAAGWKPSAQKALLATVADRDKKEAIPLIKQFWRSGYKIYATNKTAQALEKAGVKVEKVGKIGSEEPTVLDIITAGSIDFVINTVTLGKQPERDGFMIRRAAVENDCRYFTSLDTLLA
ncbi:MAG: carbamoyl-phosphate synthase large subunit, partial [Firmicutes bacterium]|nr:carbamoyl-phosphate synthase large subunit [Bacillota bacterium]